MVDGTAGGVVPAGASMATPMLMRPVRTMAAATKFAASQRRMDCAGVGCGSADKTDPKATKLRNGYLPLASVG